MVKRDGILTSGVRPSKQRQVGCSTEILIWRREAGMGGGGIGTRKLMTPHLEHDATCIICEGQRLHKELQ